MINVDVLLQKTDLVDLVNKAGGNPEKAYGHFRCACPLHGGENETGFAIYEKDGRQLWKCFSGDCGGGDAISFVEKWKGLDFKRACEFLGADTQADPDEVLRLAILRAERMKAQLEQDIAEAKAAREALQEAKRHIQYHETMKEWARIEWVKRGIDECYQGLWTLGSCDDRAIRFKGQEYHTPTLTIPIVDTNYELLNIKHRLINPPKPNDKYRPEREGLGAFPPFIAFPDVGWRGDLTWIVEGEIKSMVMATISPDEGWQFIGVPGQDAFDKLPLEQLKGRKVIVVPDPGAEAKAWTFAKKIGARFLMTPEKIDDLILTNEYTGDWLSAMSRQARRP